MPLESEVSCLLLDSFSRKCVDRELQLLLCHMQDLGCVGQEQRAAHGGYSRSKRILNPAYSGSTLRARLFRLLPALLKPRRDAALRFLVASHRREPRIRTICHESARIIMTRR